MLLLLLLRKTRNTGSASEEIHPRTEQNKTEQINAKPLCPSHPIPSHPTNHAIKLATK
jgi:hypothetical protein